MKERLTENKTCYEYSGERYVAQGKMDIEAEGRRWALENSIQMP